MPPPGVGLHILNARHKSDGRGSASNPEKFFNQDQQELKNNCLLKSVQFIDETFPPEKCSLREGLLSPTDLANVQWLRPAEISANPTFVLDGVSRFDFEQGKVGNCWFLACIGALTFKKNIFEQVVPVGQRFDENYCGLFYFRFWRFGRWIDVVIDDKLPTLNGRLLFVHSKHPDEFWPALLEKAYAKVCGSYKDMDAGLPAEAMMDFTGGVHMNFLLSDPPSDLFEMMCRAARSVALMACSTSYNGSEENTSSSNGLVPGHAYAVTGVKEVMSRETGVRLVRLWNPWGKGEWNWDWSDSSPLWQTVSDEDRRLCLSVDDNGEFWMTLDDFCTFYSNLDICGISPDFLDRSSSLWRTSSYEGRWVSGTTAGGYIANSDTYWTNPQYQFEICAEQFVNDGEKNLLVSLIQNHDKRNRHLVENFYIGFCIFEVEEQYQGSQWRLPASFFSSHEPVISSKSYSKSRELSELVMLKPGHYLLVPSTFDPHKMASFLLTIYSKDKTCSYDNSGDCKKYLVEKGKPVKNTQDERKSLSLFSQYSNKFNEVEAEQIQRLLNDKVLKGMLKSGGFSIDACRNMVALMDIKTSITGSLNSDEFYRLSKKIVAYSGCFFDYDVSDSGKLSLSELGKALRSSGIGVGDTMLNLLALRYGASSGQMTLESFISLMLRFDRMYEIFKLLSDGSSITLGETEWMLISMYT